MSTYILAIESSCDDTSAAVAVENKILANVVASQNVHELYGGVVPELASRAHQQNIIPVVDIALKNAKVKKNEIKAVAFTRGPGLMGSLLVGTSFVKSFSLAMGIPMIEVNHLNAHVLAHFARNIHDENTKFPSFPFLCLLVSGGHTQIILVRDFFEMEIIGRTIDDAAGEAFDKIAKIMGLPYPGGPLINKIATEGNPFEFNFPEPRIAGFDFSFSGLKTSVLYFLRDRLKENPDFIDVHKNSIAASVQRIIVEVLLKKLSLAAKELSIQDIAIAGGVSANTFLRYELKRIGVENDWNVFIPPFEFCTDNAAMVAVAGYYKFLRNEFATQDITPLARM